MLHVGLTGNVASGKSTVAALFAKWGARVIDADDLAREAVSPGTDALARIREIWGESVLDERGRLDREAMRRIAFSDPEARRRLEEIVHPAVSRLYGERVEAARARGDRIVIGAIPLLYEVGMEDRFDLVLLVDAPLDQRIDRLVRFRGLDRDEARRLDAAQRDAGEKRRRADLVLDNDRDIPALERHAWEVWKQLEKLAS